MKPGAAKQPKGLRPAAAQCVKRLLGFALVSAALLLFWGDSALLRPSRDWLDLGQDLADGKSRVAQLELPPASALKVGDEITVRQDFLTDSVDPVTILPGTRGTVLQVDEEGDAEIKFVRRGREWVYRDKFPHLSVMGGDRSPAKKVVQELASHDVRAQLTAKSAAGTEPRPAKEVQSARPPPSPTPGPPSRPGARSQQSRKPVTKPTLAEIEPTTKEPKAPAPVEMVEDRPIEEPSSDTSAAASAGPYKAVRYAKKHECQSQGTNFGDLVTMEACDKATAEADECGGYFMFSKDHPDWQCRCCAVSGADDGPPSDNWDVYTVQTKRRKQQQGRAKAKYVEVVTGKQHECDEQAMNFGFAATPAKCDAMTAANPACGAHFMFSKSHPDWACRCCTRSGAEDGPASENWDVYAVQAPLPESRKALAAAAVLDPAIGLPVLAERPSWLMKDDRLVVDGRPDPGSGGGILIIQAVLMDATRGWGKKQGQRPRWLRSILAANRAHARKHGHVLVIRAKPTQPQLTPWQIRGCKQKSREVCIKDNERENYNWEKHLALGEYLLSDQKFTHVMMLDADAALIQPDHNTLAEIIGILEKRKKDLFLTDEDWLQNGAGRINGGLIMAKNTPFCQGLFQDTFDAHVLGPVPLKNWRIGVQNVVCSSNEQICLNDLWKGGRGHIFADHTTMLGGTKWNHGAEVGGFDDPGVEILHFMGGAKGTAGDVLCDGKRDVTGEGKSGYGCEK